MRTRPSDGKPVGTAFDYEEYLTRLEDRRAADPEKYQRERAAARRFNRHWRDKAKETSDFDNCNAALLEIRLGYPDPANYNRLLDIWGTVVLVEQSERLDNIHLSQADRIANKKNLERCEGRVRGVGAAARRAGY